LEDHIGFVGALCPIHANRDGEIISVEATRYAWGYLGYLLWEFDNPEASRIISEKPLPPEVRDALYKMMHAAAS
jgi:hypothetical protein